jgi:hypothetical protein
MKHEFGDGYTNLLFHNKSRNLAQDRLLIGIPMTGLVRSEWMMARYGQCIPPNWAHQEANQWINQASPINYAVAEARNIIIDIFVKSQREWLLFIDSDVILPPDAFVKFNQYMLEKKYPVVCGLYFAKCHPPEPLMYRGRGNGHFTDWQPGDLVWLDGIPFGCTMVHRSILELMHHDAPDYLAQGHRKVKRVIDTPAGVFYDPQKGGIQTYGGTEDLAWCNRVIAGDYLAKAGWKDIAKKKYPFACDTSIFCRHISLEGRIYPLEGYEDYPLPQEPKMKPVASRIKVVA